MFVRGSLKVLIADGSRLVRERVEQVLRGLAGVEVVGMVADWQDAMRETARTSPDLVVLDVMMPGALGLQAVKAMKHASPEAQVVVFTNELLPPMRHRFLEAGASHAFDKSEEFPELWALVKKLAMAPGGSDPNRDPVTCAA